MSQNGKIKVYRNKARAQQETFTPYVPQYQKFGIEPEEYKSPTLTPGYTLAVQKTAPSQEHVRGVKPAIRQSYAEAVPSPVGRGRGPLPNVGNNVEQTWSSVDGEIEDDISDVDLNHPMIDNNEYVTDEAFGLENKLESNHYMTKSVMEEAIQNDNVFEAIKELEEDTYLLMMKNVNICAGPLEYIQEQTTALVFGEHEMYQGNPIPIDDIIVIKRVKLKVGVFLV